MAAALLMMYWLWLRAFFGQAGSIEIDKKPLVKSIPRSDASNSFKAKFWPGYLRRIPPEEEDREGKEEEEVEAVAARPHQSRKTVISTLPN